jgi:hypothetical protein
VPLTLSPSERSLRARAAAHALHAQGGTSTKAGTAAFLERFERAVDPDGSLPPEERARRAEHARKSYMSSLALKSSRARRRNEKAAAASDAATALEVRHACAEPHRE